MKDRIRQLMESMHMNQQTFANHIHLSTATLSSILLGRTKPTLNTVEAIQKYCPTVNLGWLMNGQGEIYATNDPSLLSSDSSQQTNLDAQDLDLFSSADPLQQLPSSSSGSNIPPSTGNNNQPERNGQFVSPAHSASSDTGTGVPVRSGSYAGQQHRMRQQVQNITLDAKNIDKYTRHITEIRVYYDDQTWETFVPKKSS